MCDVVCARVTSPAAAWPACGTCEASLPEPTWSVCAGAYAVGTLGSNECPTNYIRIEAEGACQIAAAAAGQAYERSETDSGFPRGCYSVLMTTGSWSVYFNMAATGAGVPSSKLLCSGARSLARPSCVLFVYTCGYLCSHPLGSLGCSIEYPIETPAESTIEYGTALLTRPYEPLSAPTVPTGPQSTVPCGMLQGIGMLHSCSLGLANASSPNKPRTIQ